MTVERESRELSNPVRGIISLNRDELLASPRFEPPTSAEDALFNFCQNLAPIQNIAGFGITQYEFGLAGTLYMKDPSDDMTDEDIDKEIDAMDDLVEGLIKLKLPPISFSWVTQLGTRSFEEVVGVEKKIRELTEEEKYKLINGETPEGMSEVEGLRSYFQIIAGTDKSPIESPVYIKFE